MGRERGHKGIIRKNKEGNAKRNEKGDYRVNVSLGREVIKKWLSPEQLKLCDIPCPKLIVFGLDGTVWVPEMRQLYPPFSKSIDGIVQDKNNQPLHYLANIKNILNELTTDEKWKNTKIGFISCTELPDYAEQCLKLMAIDEKGEKTLEYIADYQEIGKDSMKKQMEKIIKKSGIDYKHILFFDQFRYNIFEIEELKVVSVFTPSGVTKEIWDTGLRRYTTIIQSGEQIKAPPKQYEEWVPKMERDWNRRMKKTGIYKKK